MVHWKGIEKVPVELLDKDLSEKRTDMVWRLPRNRSANRVLLRERCHA
jgi:hypothetical protein